jgi:hypothetical protein
MIEVNGPKHISMVGNGQCRHPMLFRLGDEAIQMARAVQEAVLRMDMKVDEIRMLHRSSQ